MLVEVASLQKVWVQRSVINFHVGLGFTDLFNTQAQKQGVYSIWVDQYSARLCILTNGITNMDSGCLGIGSLNLVSESNHNMRSDYF